MRIKSTHPESQGEFVIINDEDFDPEKHTPFDPAPEADAPKRKGGRPARVVEGDAE